MSLENIFVFRKNQDNSYTYVPATGLLFGFGKSGTVVLGAASNQISGSFNSILGGSANKIENDAVTTSIIGGGCFNRILAGCGNFITAGSSNLISGTLNSSNVIVGGCTNTIIGNQSLIGGGCGNFLGGGTGLDIWRGARTNVIVGGQYNCAFAANPRELASVYAYENGWQGFGNNFGGILYYNPPIESAIIAGTQNRIGGCASFIGAGVSNCAVCDRSVIINGSNNRNFSRDSAIIHSCDSAITNGFGNFIGQGHCNRIGLQITDAPIFASKEGDKVYFASIGNGCLNNINVLNRFFVGQRAFGSIINGCNNRILENVDYGLIGNGQNNLIYGSSNSSIINGINNTITSTDYNVSIGVNTIVNGLRNRISGLNASCSFIGGGENNTSTCCYTMIGGGFQNCVTASYSTIAGGYGNQATAFSSNVGGGKSNSATASYSNVGGGWANLATESYSSVAGGLRNCARANISTVGGGRYNVAGGDYSFVGGGWANCATGCYSATVGGHRTCAVGFASFIGGGICHATNAEYSYIVGGRCATINRNHIGAAVLGDGDNRAHNSSGPYTLTLDFISGTYIKNRTIIQNDSYVPSSHTSFGVSGQISFDANYFYRHNGTNWTRTAMSIW